MALIIPEAQTPFSMVEQPRLNPDAPTIGDGIAAVADTFIAVQAQKVKAENDRLVRETRLAALEDLDQARVEFENDGNLEGLSDRWEATSGGIAEKYAAGLPAHLRKDFDLSLRETIAPQTAAIRRREFALFQDRERAAFNSSMRGYERLAAAAPDQASREAVFKNVEQDLQAQVDAGLLSAVEAERIMADLPANTARIEARRLIIEDPGAYLDRADEFGAVLDPAEAADLALTARGNVIAEDTRRRREDEIAQKAWAAELKSDVDDAIKILDGGRKVEDLPDLLDRTRGTPEHDRLIAAIDGGGAAENFTLMTPAERKAYLKQEEARATKDPSDVGRLNRLRDMDGKLDAEARADPLAYIRDRGIAVVDPVDIGDAASVKKRRALAEAAHGEYTPGAGTIKYFDQAEADQLGAVLSGDNPEAAVAVIATIERTFGEAAPLALAQLGEKDPVAHLAGAVALDTSDLTTSRYILQGRKMLKTGGGAKIAPEVRRSVAAEFRGQLGVRIMDDGRIVQDATALDLALAAADAHYAASGMGIENPKSTEAKDAYRLSVQAVLSRNDQGGIARGGSQVVAGVRTVLPGNLTADQVERALVYFGEDHWTRASVTGKPPLWGASDKARPVTAFSKADRERLAVQSLGGGLYALGVRRDDGSLVFLRDPSRPDGTFVFSLESLVLGVDR